MNELQKAQQTIGVLQNCLAEEPILDPRGIHILDSVRLHDAHLYEAIETDKASGKAVSAVFSDRLMDQLEKLTDKSQQHAAPRRVERTEGSTRAAFEAHPVVR